MIAFIVGVFVGVLLATAASGAAAWLIYKGWGVRLWTRDGGDGT